MMNGKQILEIQADGLTYVDDEGNKQFINFAECFENYFHEATSPEYIEGMKELNPHMQWDEEGIKNYIEETYQWKRVGDRCILGKPLADGPFIEFYTEPPIRFNFDTVEEFHEILYRIKRFGWRTFDLT